MIAVFSFIAALSIYFIGSFRDTERDYAVYSTIEAPTLPIISADIDGSYLNTMHGYMQDMGNKASFDSITPLPTDRRLGIRIRLYDNIVTELSYEVRSLDQEHYIEKTEVEVPQTDANGDIYAVLPIQNMIEKDTPYLLKIILVMGEKKVNYYTRIIWTDKDDIFRMVQSASDFTNKTFDYEAARELTMYLESSESADNSSLAAVGINSSFSQITWGQSGMQLDEEPDITIKEYNGIMGAVEIKYGTKSSEAGEDNSETYENVDEFTMRAGTDRVYIMNYKRSTSQIFDGSKTAFAGNRIRLGIISEDKLQTVKSENGRYIVFKSDKELWSYDQKDKTAVNIYSARSEDERIKASYNNFDLKILSVDDDGNVEYVIYGYMSRGRHEGYNGITYHKFNNAEQTIEEKLFIPIVNNFEEIKQELDELCTKSSSGNIYLKQQDAIYAIDESSFENMTVASDLHAENYAISADQTKIAWIDSNIDAPNSIKLADLANNTTNTINNADGEVYAVLGFCGNDLVYGTRNADDNMTVNGKVKGRPVYAIHIVDSDLNSVMDYSKEGLFFENISIEGDRIHLSQYRWDDTDERFRYVSRDTIVSSEQRKDESLQFISSADSETKKKQYYVDLDEKIKTTRSLSIVAPQNISYEKAGSIDITAQRRSDEAAYYAYANGRLVSRYDNLTDAIDSIYDEIGWVRDRNCAVLYNRSDKSSAYTIKDPYAFAGTYLADVREGGLSYDSISNDGYMILDAQGLELNKLTYYIGKGAPVLAMADNASYCIIYAYTRDSIGIMYPADSAEQSTSVSMELNEAAQYFAKYDSDFTCFVRYPGK